jgi:hypothetical protein
MADVLRNIDGFMLPHAKLLDLRRRGAVSLGVMDDDAVKLLLSSSKYPKTQGIKYGFYFWGLAAIALIAGSIYLSFAATWWAFVPGLIFGSWIERVNKKAVRENCISYAFQNAGYYYDVMLRNGWSYAAHVDTSVLVEEFLTEALSGDTGSQRVGKPSRPGSSIVEDIAYLLEVPDKELGKKYNEAANSYQPKQRAEEGPDKQQENTKKKTASSNMEIFLLLGVISIVVLMFYAFERDNVNQNASKNESKREAQIVYPSKSEKTVNLVGETVLLKRPLVVANRIIGVGQTVVVVSQNGRVYKIMSEYEGVIYEDEVSETALRGARD